MNRKDRNLLVFASMGAIALSILTLVSEGSRAKAWEEVSGYTTSCADIVFGGTFTAGSSLSTTTETFYTCQGITLASSTPYSSSTCYKSDLSTNTTAGAALKMGTTSSVGSVTFNFANSYVISSAKVYANPYSSAQDKSTKRTVLTVSTSAYSAGVAKTLTYIDVSSVDVSDLSQDTTETAKCAYVFDGLDGGSSSRTSSTSLTVTTNGTTGPFVAKIVLTILSVSESGSSSSSSSSTSKTLSGIAITTNPTKTTYTAGETLNNDGLVVTASYSDDTSLDITDDVDTTYTPGLGTALTVDNTSVGISYTYGSVTKTASYSITVNAATKTLSGIAITGTATTTSYTAGQSFNSSGLTVTASFSDSSSYNVTSSVTWTPSPLTSGTTSVTASYTYLAVTKTAIYSGITVASAGTAKPFMVRFKEILAGSYCDSIYLKYGDWDCIIDGGNSGDAATVSSSLTEYCTDHKLDLYIATHSHNDHAGIFTSGTASDNVFIDGGVTSFGYIVDCGSARSVAFWTNYRTVIRPYMVSNGGTYIPVHSLFNSDSGYTAYNGLSILNISGDNGSNDTPATLASSASGDVSLHFLNTGCYLEPGATTDSDPNETSVSVCLSAWNERFIMCGDGDSGTQNGIIANYSTSGSPNLWSSSNDVYLKANHHGSNTNGSNDQTWIDWVAPDHVLISAAIVSANQGSSGVTTSQHPAPATVVRFEKATYSIYWNGINGSFSVSSDDGGVTTSFAGSARSADKPYYYNGSIVTGEENTTMPMSKWATYSVYSSIAKTSATGHDSRKIDSPWASPLGSFINLNVDYEALSKLEVKHPDVNEHGELYDAETGSYC